MHIHLHLYAILSLLSAFFSLLALLAAWRRSAVTSRSLPPLLASMTLWSGLYATLWMNISMESKIFWFDGMYLAVTALPTLFLLFILEFTRSAGWLTRRRLVLLSVHPVGSLLLSWTNRYHHMYYQAIHTVEESGFATLQFVRGPLYIANVAYSYLIIGAALVVLGLGFVRSGPMYRQQYRLVVLGAILPWAASIYSEYHFSALGGLDLAPLTFGLSGIILVVAILRTHFLDLIPVARSYVVDNMSDGIIVLNGQGRIVDLNSAMQNFLEEPLSFYMGKEAVGIFSTWMEDAESRVEIRLPKDPSRYVELRTTHLYDRNHFLNGHLMVFHDITERKQVEKRLRYVNDRLQSQLIKIGLLQSRLREQAIRDPLTNLFNRRYLEETLDRELARAAREEYSVCLMMIDLDHFKRVNDTHGHDAGDQVLKAVASTLMQESRRGDFACRYGGEEFVIAMPNINMDVAYERAEALRNTLNSLKVPYGDDNLSVTISMGIACYPLNGQTRDLVLRAADQAMYAAKLAGRDHILSYDQLQLSEGLLNE